MARVQWARPQDKKFQWGVDRAVIYPNMGRGYPWNGLVSVDENFSGGEIKSFFQDGIKQSQKVVAPDYAANIEAFSYPDQFNQCLGIQEVRDRFYATEQNARPFGLTYRTMVGDGVKGEKSSYKLHFIYNASVLPTSLPFSTKGQQVELTNFGWEISGVPVRHPGFRPAVHYILDYMPDWPNAFETLEGIIYGRSGSNPRLPLPQEISAHFNDWHVLYPSPNTYPSPTTYPGAP